MFDIFKSKKRRQLEVLVRAAKHYNELAAMKEDMLAYEDLTEDEVITLATLEEGMAAIRSNIGMEKLIAKQENEIDAMFKQLGL